MAGEEKLKKTVFFVEADSFAVHQLWEKNHEALVWVQDNIGYKKLIGIIGNKSKRREVWLSFSWATISGELICFYSVEGRYCDWVMVENYIQNNYPTKFDNNTRWAMVDASNFHTVLHYLEEKNEPPF